MYGLPERPSTFQMKLANLSYKWKDKWVGNCTEQACSSSAGISPDMLSWATHLSLSCSWGQKGFPTMGNTPSFIPARQRSRPRGFEGKLARVWGYVCVYLRGQAKDTKQIQKWGNTERGFCHPKKRKRKIFQPFTMRQALCNVFRL